MVQKRLHLFKPLIFLVGLLWVIEVVNQLTGHGLNAMLGLEPRAITGLVGVPAMPFLHGSFGHLAANTVPMVVLGAIGLLIAPRRFLRASVLIVIASGLAVWLVARPNTIHVGASGLIFGWLGFLLALGVIERSWQALVGSVVVLLLYGGMIWGVLPGGEASVSWEAHLFGAAAGVLAAWVYRRR